jgi:hypothetical protein
LKRSAKLLADITKQVAVVTYPIIGESREKMAISGTANLARSGEDLGLSLSPILEALEEQVVILRLLMRRAQRFMCELVASRMKQIFKLHHW